MPPHSGWGLLRALLPGPSHAVSREARSCSKTQHLLLPLNKRTPQEKKTPQVTCYQDIGLKLVPCQGSHQHLSDSSGGLCSEWLQAGQASTGHCPQ